MMIIVICSVKGISAQNPAPHVSTSRIGDWRTAGSTAHAATSTTKVAASANTNASGIHRSVHAVARSANRSTAFAVRPETPPASADLVIKPLRWSRGTVHEPGGIVVIMSAVGGSYGRSSHSQRVPDADRVVRWCIQGPVGG